MTDNKRKQTCVKRWQKDVVTVNLAVTEPISNHLSREIGHASRPVLHAMQIHYLL